MSTRFPLPLVSSGRPVVLLDLDDVTFPTRELIIRFTSEVYGMRLEENDFTRHGLDKVWGCTRDEAEVREGEFLEWAFSIPPSLGAVEVLEWLRPYYDFDIVTARWSSLEEITFRWVASHLKDKIRDVHVCGWRPKPEVASAIPGVVVVVDDYLKSLKLYQEALGIKVVPVLFGEQPWNLGWEEPPGTRKVRDWWEFGELLWTYIGGTPLRSV